MTDGFLFDLLKSLKCFNTALLFSGKVSLSFIFFSSIPFIFDTSRRALANRSCYSLNSIVDSAAFNYDIYSCFKAKSSLSFA